MHRKPHPMDHFISHPVFSHLACAGSIPAMLEAAAQRDWSEDRSLSPRPSQSAENTAEPEHDLAGRRRAGRRLSLSRIGIQAAYAAIARKTVTLVTTRWRGQPGKTRLDPSVGALLNTGLFLRPHTYCGREDDAEQGEGRIVPVLTVAMTQPRPR